jgi:hypothetical protein
VLGTLVPYQVRAETLLAVWLDRELGELTDEDEETEKTSFSPLLLHCDHPEGNEAVAVVSNGSLIQADGLILSSKASTRKTLRFRRRRLKDITTPGVSAGCKSASHVPDNLPGARENINGNQCE